MTLRLKILMTVASILCVVGVFLLLHRGGPAPAAAPAAAAPDTVVPATTPEDKTATTVYAHNLRLRQGEIFRVYIRWIKGKLVRTRPEVNPSFDEPDTFVIEIDKGVIRVKLQDIVDFLNSGADGAGPLKNVTIAADGDTLKVHGTVHKIVPLPVEIAGQLTPEADGRVKFHVNKINVLKIPLKGLLGGLHVELADLVHKTGMAGVQIVDNDIFFNTQTLLPAPHIRGRMTSLKLMPPDIEVIYGGALADDAKLAQWHNFLRLSGGTVDFGKLTMRHTDLTMIDASKDEWFNLDLVNYQAQVVSGYSHMTPRAGLEIYMPSADDKPPAKQRPAVTLEWLKNRNAGLPADVPVK